jgi:hypothetical protein
MPGDEEFPVVYANTTKITHVATEFLLDFKRMGPESRDAGSAPTLVRIIMQPGIAKELRDALIDNVHRYEEQFGEIPAPPKGPRPDAH